MIERVSLVSRIKAWYRGPEIPPPPNDPNSPLVFITMGRRKQPPLARLLGQFGGFWIKHWQWIIGTVLAVIGIVVSIK